VNDRSGPHPVKARPALVLVGAGAAHLEVLRRARAFAGAGLSLVLIAPGDAFYSGMAPGVLAGEYRAEEATIRLGSLAARSGWVWIADRALRIDRPSQLVIRAAGAPIAFDWLSIDVGSVAPPLDGPDVVPVRPPGNLRALADRVACAGRGPSGGAKHVDAFRVVVAGGGAAACETALAFRARWKREQAGRKLEITLLAGGPTLLPGWPSTAAWLVEQKLTAEGIAVRKGDGSSVVELAEHVARTVGGPDYPFELLVNATGSVAHPLVAQSDLAHDGGYLRVDRTLRSLASERIFGAGDCVAIAGLPLPRSGVQAVHQGRQLAWNLLAAATGRRLRRYRPRPWHLQILNLGDGTALAAWGPVTASGRWVRRLKDRIDRNYVRSFDCRLPEA
jgi:NADH dehydrogenase FAD-containing subunit